ncbi:hypothetical protein KKE06_02665 [Candidatus Micrarchaeota archaeon]|nr:hypothetical protein [Candidatus Micrarchaeota archaeon]MBU1930834.1 hypothetical protein [Candidatus Micrarchaeota archaeon]
MHFKWILLLLFLALAIQGVQAATFSIANTYSPAPAEPGQLVTIWATITNSENAIAENVEVTLDLGYPFSTSEAGKSSAFFDQILSHQSKVAKLEIQTDKGALNGTYTIIVNVSEDGQSRIGKDLSITITAIKPQVELIESSISEVSVGGILETTLTLRNTGSSTAKNILIGTGEDRTVTSTGIVVDRPIKTIGPSFSFLESIEPGATETVLLKLGVDSSAEQKTHVVPLTINFQDTNRSEYSITRYLGVLVRAIAELDGTIVQDQTTAFPGTTAEFTINVFNRGSATARNVVVTLNAPPNVNITSEKKVFIGTMDPDDFDSFKVETTISGDTIPGELPISLLFEYKNQDFSTQSVQQQVSLNVVSQAEAQQNGGAGLLGNIILVIVLIVIIYFVYKRFFKKKK